MALRITPIYGEQDSLVTYFLKRYKKFIRFGNRSAFLQHSYAGNLAWAHIVADQSLARDATVGGQAYFITDDTPAMNRFQFLETIFAERGNLVTSYNVPFFVIYAATWIAMVIFYLLTPICSLNADLNLDLLSYTNHSKTFRRTKAEKMLGYKPVFSYEDSMAVSRKFYKDV